MSTSNYQYLIGDYLIFSFNILNFVLSSESSAFSLLPIPSTFFKLPLDTQKFLFMLMKSISNNFSFTKSILRCF